MYVRMDVWVLYVCVRACLDGCMHAIHCIRCLGRGWMYPYSVLQRMHGSRIAYRSRANVRRAIQALKPISKINQKPANPQNPTNLKPKPQNLDLKPQNAKPKHKPKEFRPQCRVCRVFRAFSGSGFRARKVFT